MARILISEPNPDVRALYEHMVRRVGHEPLALWEVTPESAETIDLVLVESADPACAELALEARRLRPSLPIVAASIFPPGLNSLVDADAHLLKPFSAGELRLVMALVLAA
jgi:CheY-like chemotaxis protein